MGWIVVLIIFVIILVIWLRRRKEPTQRLSSRPAITEVPRKAVSRQSKTRELLQLGYTRKLRLTIKYETRNPLPGEPAIKVRDIDIYGLGGEYFDAYCHYRSAQRTFKISRVLWARLSDEMYQIPPDYVPSGWVTEGWGDIEDTEDRILESPPTVLHKHTSLPSLKEKEQKHPIPRGPTPPLFTGERAKSCTRYDWQKHWEESIVTLFPEEWSPALPYLYEAYKLEVEGADQQKVEEVLRKAQEADSQATAFYKARRSIIKKVRNQRHESQSKE
jgi:hypothetical protein